MSIRDRIIKNNRECTGAPWLTLVLSSEEEITLSYSEFINCALIWADAYSKLNVKVQDKIVIALPHSLDQLAAHVGALLVGAVPILYNFPSIKHPKVEYLKLLNHLLDQAKPRLLVSEQDILEASSTESLQVLSPDSVMENPGIAILTDLKIDQHQPAIIQFSSGTTGAKKGVIFNHDALEIQLDILRSSIEISPKDVIVSWLPLYHDMGFVACWLLPLIQKVRLVSMSPFNWIQSPIMLFKYIEKYSGTHTWLPNFAFEVLSKINSNHDLSTMKMFISCSEMVRDRAINQFLAKQAKNGVLNSMISTSYAMAENVFMVTQSQSGTPLKRIIVNRASLEKGEIIEADESDNTVTLISSGHPGNFISLGIFDSDSLAPIFVEKSVGRIGYRSLCQHSGYIWSNKESTFTNSFYITEDLGFIYKRELFVLGRQDEVLNIAGKNIYPQDIEEILNQSKSLIPGRNVACSHYVESHGTEVLIIIAETKLPQESWLELALNIKSLILNQLDLVVKDVILLKPSSLIKSTSGKLSRSLNKKAFYLKEHDMSADVSTQSENKSSKNNSKNDSNFSTIIESLIRIICEINSIPIEANAVSVDTHLFETGLLDSFNLIQFKQECEESFLSFREFSNSIDLSRLTSIQQVADKINSLSQSSNQSNRD